MMGQRTDDVSDMLATADATAARLAFRRTTSRTRSASTSGKTPPPNPTEFDDREMTDAEMDETEAYLQVFRRRLTGITREVRVLTELVNS